MGGELGQGLALSWGPTTGDLASDVKGTWLQAERTSCRLRVSPASFAADKLCSCFSEQGWAGQGATCTRCKGHMEVEVYENTTFGQYLSVCACPENKVPLFRNGEQLGNSCYRCHGKGCQRSCSGNCTAKSFNRCAEGYEGQGSGELSKSAQVLFAPTAKRTTSTPLARIVALPGQSIRCESL